MNIINLITSEEFKTNKRTDLWRGILVKYILAKSVLCTYKPTEFP